MTTASQLVVEQGIPSLRPTIAGTNHIVAAGHYLAAQAAYAILENGGNAIDAGVCAGLVLGVVQSDIVNIAGVAPIMIYLAESQQVITISGLGWWPQALDPQLFLRDHGGQIPEGLLRTVVPAAPDGWITALAEYGTMSFGEVAASAIGFARDGFVMHPLMAQTLETYSGCYARWPSSAAIYLPNGRAPKVGEIFVQSDLARSLQYMVDCETAAAAKGGRLAGLQAARDSFYKGDIAHTIVDFHRQNGGLLTMEDLAGFRADIEPALDRKFGSSTIYSCGAWCQGPTFLQILSTLDGIDLAKLGHNSTQYIHMLAEAMKLCFSDRHHYFGDPRFIDVPLNKLLDPAYCAMRRSQIQADRAWPGMPPPGLTSACDEAQRPAPSLPSLDTSYVAVIDRHGNAFSATPSDVSHDTPVIPGTGLCPSSRGSQSWADPAHPSGVAPGKRPRLTPAPFMVRSDKGQIYAFGTPGGDVQLQAILQVWLNIEVFGMTPQAAVEAPRFGTFSFPNSFEPHAYQAGMLNIEKRLGTHQIEELKALGHDVALWPDFFWLAGAVCYTRQREGGIVEGAADPRRSAYAIGR